jgi:MFS-type transporter involved in bile tolerance (Atg22 family)
MGNRRQLPTQFFVSVCDGHESHASILLIISPCSLSIASAVCGGFWLICAIPWFFIEKKRPGIPLPSDQNYLTQGWVST